MSRYQQGTSGSPADSRKYDEKILLPAIAEMSDDRIGEVVHSMCRDEACAGGWTGAIQELKARVGQVIAPKQTIEAQPQAQVPTSNGHAHREVQRGNPAWENVRASLRAGKVPLAWEQFNRLSWTPEQEERLAELLCNLTSANWTRDGDFALPLMQIIALARCKGGDPETARIAQKLLDGAQGVRYKKVQKKIKEEA